MEEIPFVDLKSQHRRLLDEILSTCETIFSNAAFIGGPEVEGFEREFADYCGAGACAGVTSGTDALSLTFVALDVRPGDEIITTPATFMATTEAISHAGGRFRFVDCDPEFYTLDAAQAVAAVTDRTVGIVPVHLYGQAADLDPILALARNRGLWVVEDACQAHGATYRERPCGSLGTAGCFSFYPGKNLGACGEAGGVVSHDGALIDRIKVLRDHGQDRKYSHIREGYNGRLDALQAAILRIKLRHLDEWNARRRWVAERYQERLQAIPDLILPTEPDYSRGVYHLYVVRTPARDRLREHLGEHGVQTGLHYPTPLHLQPAYAELGYREGQFPNAERLSREGLSLPMHPELDLEQIDRVADAVTSFFGAPVS